MPEQCQVLCEVVVTGCTTYHYSMHMLVVDVVLVNYQSPQPEVLHTTSSSVAQQVLMVHTTTMLVDGILISEAEVTTGAEHGRYDH